MEGRSRGALAQARERLEAALGAVDAATASRLGEELAAVAELLDGNYPLRRALADDNTAGRDRVALIQRVLGNRVSPTTLGLLADVVSLRWTSALDLTSALGDLAAEAVIASAQLQQALDDVEDELFRFARILEREPGLSLALSDPALPAERKQALLVRLLEGRAQSATLGLVRAALAATRGRGLDRRLDQLSLLAAARRHRVVAVVRVARPLADDQAERLRAALSRTYGRDIHLQVDLDPAVLGGAIVQVGDEILDGSVARRIEQARTRLG